MKPTITAFKNSPDGGKGLARDMRVRWAFEEVGQPYDVRLVTFEEMEQPEYLALHPFGQIPAYQEGGLVLFESGAIVLRVAESHPGLLPADANGRARAISWMFAALNTVEPAIVEREAFVMFEEDKPWFKERISILEDRIRETLSDLSVRLGDASWLDQAFSAGDLLMVSVLLRLDGPEIVKEFPNLLAYVARGEARSAYRRAFADQLAVFKANAEPIGC